MKRIPRKKQVAVGVGAGVCQSTRLAGCGGGGGRRTTDDEERGEGQPRRHRGGRRGFGERWKLGRQAVQTFNRQQCTRASWRCYDTHVASSNLRIDDVYMGNKAPKGMRFVGKKGAPPCGVWCVGGEYGNSLGFPQATLRR